MIFFFFSTSALETVRRHRVLPRFTACVFVVWWPPVRWRPRSALIGLQPVPPQHLGQTFRVLYYSALGRAEAKKFHWNYWKCMVASHEGVLSFFLERTGKYVYTACVCFVGIVSFLCFASEWINFTFDYHGGRSDDKISSVFTVCVIYLIIIIILISELLTYFQWDVECALHFQKISETFLKNIGQNFFVNVS